LWRANNYFLSFWGYSNRYIDANRRGHSLNWNKTTCPHRVGNKKNNVFCFFLKSTFYIASEKSNFMHKDEGHTPCKPTLYMSFLSKHRAHAHKSCMPSLGSQWCLNPSMYMAGILALNTLATCQLSLHYMYRFLRRLLATCHFFSSKSCYLFMGLYRWKVQSHQGWEFILGSIKLSQYFL
jgi:hypothetical protein